MDLYLFPFYLCIFLYGTIIGSFLNVCILRIPARESFITGSSHCMSCGKRLKWWELIPLFSYLALRGRCSACHTPISPQYPLIEGANGVLWLLIFYTYGFSLDAVLGSLFVSCLLVLSVIDARTREIPLGTNIFILVLGIIRTILYREEWLSHLLGFIVISGILLLLFWLSGGGAIGGGDVKLMAAAGLFLGLKLTVLAFFLGCIIGSVIHIIRMKFFGAGRELAMGPYLSAGLAIALLWGEALCSWYLGFMFA